MNRETPLCPSRPALGLGPYEILAPIGEPRTRDALDAIAATLDRDRSYVVNQALATYVETHQWQVEHIQQGLREANAGEFASEAKVKKVLARLRRK